MGLILLSDNDLILKLACCDLLGELPKIFGAGEADFRVLASARFKISPKNKQLVAKHGAASAQRAHDFICRVAVIESPGNNDAERASLVRPGIDAGEQVLFSATRDCPEFYVLTGDKNSLRALDAAPKVEAVKNRMAHRVICFEAVLLAMLTEENFAARLPRIVAGAKCDTALQAIFGLDLETTYEKAVEGLTSYLTALRRETGDLLGEL